MQIHKLDISLVRYPSGKVAWALFEYDKGLCGCHLFTIGPVCFTLLGDECFQANK